MAYHNSLDHNIFLPFKRTTTTFLNKFDGSALADRASMATAADLEPTNVPPNSNCANLPN